MRLALRTLNTGRLTLPAACGGAMKQSLAMAAQWAKERVQWGAPVGHHEAVAAKIGTIAADLYAVESLTWLTSAMADRRDRISAWRRPWPSCSAPRRSGARSTPPCRSAGGRGYETADSLRARGELPMPMERAHARRPHQPDHRGDQRDHAPVHRPGGPGSAPADCRRYRATSGKMDLWGAAKFYARWYPKLWLPRFERPRGATLSPARLAGHLRFVERATRRLARDLFHMMGRYRQGLQRKQMVLGRLVDSGAELFAMSAVLSRAAPPSGQAGCREDWPISSAARPAGGRRSAPGGLLNNDDRSNLQGARDVLDGEYPWLEENILCTWKEDPEYS